MQWIISPAKKMREEREVLPPRDLPRFLPETERLLEILRAMPCGALKTLLECNDALAAQAFERYRTMELRRAATPAVLAYQGIQYQYMAPGVLEDGDYAFMQEHLRILSGFYGLLRPLDGVTPYRLEMRARLQTACGRDLYGFWGDRLAEALGAETDLVLNLASEEYARAVRRRLPEKTRLADVAFCEREGERLVEKGVYVKMARGEMVRFLTENRVEDLAGVKAFDRLRYRFAPGLSGKERLVFVREPRPAEKIPAGALDTVDKS